MILTPEPCSVYVTCDKLRWLKVAGAPDVPEPFAPIVSTNTRRGYASTIKWFAT